MGPAWTEWPNIEARHSCLACSRTKCHVALTGNHLVVGEVGIIAHDAHHGNLAQGMTMTNRSQMSEVRMLTTRAS